MDLSALTLLVEIIDAGNLSQAARKLKMTRANVSYHLNQLEKSVGVQLVRRTTRRVEPTEVGLRLVEHGRNIQNEMLAARETITTLGQGLQGRVGLSVPSGYGQMVMSDWLIEFKRLYPGIVLDVLFEKQNEWVVRNDPVSKLFELAKQAGFTKESFDKCLTDDKLLAQIEASRTRANEKFGVNSTPTFFINGKRLASAPTVAAFDNALEPLLNG